MMGRDIVMIAICVSGFSERPIDKSGFRNKTTSKKRRDRLLSIFIMKCEYWELRVVENS